MKNDWKVKNIVVFYGNIIMFNELRTFSQGELMLITLPAKVRTNHYMDIAFGFDITQVWHSITIQGFILLKHTAKFKTIS